MYLYDDVRSDGRYYSSDCDYALASPSFAPQLVDAAGWHINADETPWHDYNLELGRAAAVFDTASPHRSPDHDPLVIDLNPERSRPDMITTSSRS